MLAPSMPARVGGTFGVALSFAWALGACAGSTQSSTAVGTPLRDVGQLPYGHVLRSEIEALPRWGAAGARARVDPAASRALITVPGRATVRIYLGAWCSDSRREVSRFWKALDSAGAPMPFTVELIAVDQQLKAPNGLIQDADLRYVPTFVVLRGGKELGRVVESAETTIEADLGALLRADRTGLVTGRRDGAR